MLAGHYAPALALKRVAPRAPLWALFVGAQLVDIGFFALGFVGIERARLIPEAPRVIVTQGIYTHSLVAGLLWALVAGALAGRRWGARAGLGLGLAVISHWFLDALVHTPDMAVTLDMGSAVGLSLWMRPVLEWVVETGIILLGWALLRAATEGRARKRLDICVGALVVLQALATFVIPTPTSPVVMGASGLLVFAGATWQAWRVDVAQDARGAPQGGEGVASRPEM